MKRFFHRIILFVAVIALVVSCSDKPDETVANLKVSITNEVNASTAYWAFAAKAREEGYKNIANMFRAVTYAEQIHEKNHNDVLKKMGEFEFKPTAVTPKINSTLENLQTAISGEFNEYTVMYPDFIATAQKGHFNDAARSFTLAMLAEKNHEDYFKDALNILNTTESDKTVHSKLFVCTECGGMDHEPFYKCPICKADDERQFYQPRVFDANHLY